MATASAPTAAAGPPSLFIGLLDDAALFPPGNAPMSRAVAEHRAHRRSGHAGLVGPFVCPDGRLTELAAELRAQRVGSPLRVSIVVTRGPSTVGAVRGQAVDEDAVDVVALEVPLGAGDGAPGRAAEAAASLAGLSPGVNGYVEVPRGDELEPVLDVLADGGLRAKLRTGGPAPSFFPSDGDVAAFLHGCASRELAFKCTAGLHVGVRHAAAGSAKGEVLEQQGFLNILVATSASLDGARLPELTAVLGERDEGLVAKAVAGLGRGQVVRARQRFLSFGTCSVTEPIDDLVRLGLLEQRFAAR